MGNDISLYHYRCVYSFAGSLRHQKIQRVTAKLADGGKHHRFIGLWHRHLCPGVFNGSLIGSFAALSLGHWARNLWRTPFPSIFRTLLTFRTFPTNLPIYLLIPSRLRSFISAVAGFIVILFLQVGHFAVGVKV